MYSVKPKNANRFRHDYARLSPKEREKVQCALEHLAENPRPPGCICLEKNYYRLRVGDLRILYQTFDAEKLILVGAVSRRSERTYKDWKQYLK
ncbi:type II toxin-antitoxin system RelE/ParE family toxin [Desulfovirgula thermocuniculi]|uniref:type II toxin-antitoxin system RelE family toxin n=1 Tax=Desulfovirgula thermocuniculi TaxID=348842 RepID=UPI00146FA1FB